MVPLGMVKYDVKKTMLWMFVSRFIMISLFALAGVFALDFLLLEGGGESEYGWLVGVVLLYLIWVLIFVMVKIKPEINETSENNLED